MKGESTTNIVESTQQKKQKRVITGVVRDSDTNEPIIGASVWLKNSSVGAVTDIDGKYSYTEVLPLISLWSGSVHSYCEADPVHSAGRLQCK